MAKDKTTTPKLEIPDKVTAANNIIEHSGEKVTVACNMPHGLRLRLFEMVDFEEDVMGGGKKVGKIASQIGEDVIINGNSLPFGHIPDYRIVAGFALTEGVSKDFFDEWLRQQADLPAVKNGLIFAMPNETEASAKAKDFKGLRSGMERLSQEGDPRMPRRIDKGEKTAEA